MPALGRRAAGGRTAGRSLALRCRQQVHRPLPRGPRDLVVWLGIRRESPARGERVRLSGRGGGGPRRGVGGRGQAGSPNPPAPGGRQKKQRGGSPPPPPKRP